jgi:hypothetical protein
MRKGGLYAYGKTLNEGHGFSRAEEVIRACAALAAGVRF